MTIRTATLIHNPHAGSSRRKEGSLDVGAMSRRLAEVGITALPAPTTGPGDAANIARQAVSTGVDLVIAAGGDGTLNEVLQGMVGSETPLVIWPTGTANVLAQELGLACDVDRVIATIVQGEPLRISVGQAGSRYFFLMAGIGLDATIIRGVRPALKARLGETAFWFAGIAQFFARAPEPFVAEIGGTRYEAGFVAIGNASRYGGSLAITPNARIDEPVLDVCIFPPKAFTIGYTPNLIACMTGDPTRFGEVEYIKAKSVIARPTSGVCPWVQVDGEVVGQLPMEFRAVPDALTVMVHAAARGSSSAVIR